MSCGERTTGGLVELSVLVKLAGRLVDKPLGVKASGFCGILPLRQLLKALPGKPFSPRDMDAWKHRGSILSIHAAGAKMGQRSMGHVWRTGTYTAERSAGESDDSGNRVWILKQDQDG